MFPRFRAPETMTAGEQALLLHESAAQPDLRGHILYITALGTGLRLKELLGLNVGDVSPDGKQVRQRIVLKVTKGERRGEVFLQQPPATGAHRKHPAGGSSKNSTIVITKPQPSWLESCKQVSGEPGVVDTSG